MATWFSRPRFVGIPKRENVRRSMVKSQKMDIQREVLNFFLVGEGFFFVVYVVTLFPFTSWVWTYSTILFFRFGSCGAFAGDAPVI